MTTPFIVTTERQATSFKIVDKEWTREEIDELFPAGDGSLVSALLEKLDATAELLADMATYAMRHMRRDDYAVPGDAYYRSCEYLEGYYDEPFPDPATTPAAMKAKADAAAMAKLAKEQGVSVETLTQMTEMTGRYIQSMIRDKMFGVPNSDPPPDLEAEAE